MRNLVKFCVFLTVFLAMALNSCDFEIPGRTILLSEGIRGRGDDQNPGGGQNPGADYIGDRVGETIDDLLDKLETGGKNEVTTEITVDGDLCTVTLRKDGNGYDVVLSNVTLENEHALKALLYGVQKGLPAGKPIHLDFSDCYGKFIGPILGEPYVNKADFVEVILPNSVTTLYEYDVGSNEKIHTFNGFINLEKVSAPKVTEIPDKAFYNDNYYGYSPDNGFNKLAYIDFPEATSIGEEAFFGCRNLTMEGIKTPKVTEIGNGAFKSCISLTKASFPLITEIADSAFEYCENLETLEFNKDAITKIGERAFSYCEKLSGVDLPKVTEIGSSAFSGCELIPAANFPLVEEINGNTFSWCENLVTVNIPKARGEIWYSAFEGCVKLETVDFPEVTFIGISAFADCTLLKTVKIPNTTGISSDAFRNCTAIERLEFPRATSIGYVSGNAFYGCKNLTEIDLRGATDFYNNSFTNTGPNPLTIMLGDNAPGHIDGNSFAYAAYEDDSPYRDASYNTANKVINITTPSGAGTGYTDAWAKAFRGYGNHGGGGSGGIENTTITLNLNGTPLN